MKKPHKRSAASKRLQAVQTSRHFRVVKRQHTGHVIPKKHTSYPLLVMLLLITGVLLTSWTRFVAATPPGYPDPVSNSYTVHVRNPGPAPTQAATIDSPASGKRISDTPAAVQGSCPQATYIQLFRNNVASGTGLCDQTGKYQILSDLFPGSNLLMARVYSLTDIPGPDSATVSVTYAPKLTASSNTQDANGAVTPKPVSSLASPLILKTNFQYQGFYVGDWARWQLNISGGKAPYALAIDWGDGTNSLYSRAAEGDVVIEHIYKHGGGFRGSYTIQVRASDNDGRSSYLQLVGVITDPPATVAATHGGSNNGLKHGISILSSGQLGRMVKYVWPAYSVSLLMLVSFWLGEKRELEIIKPYMHRHKRHGH